MVRIPAGSFEMGDHFNERLARELPVHIVELDPYILQVQMSQAHNNTASLSNGDKERESNRLVLIV